nr:RNA-directed DNA polymerase, eukaryota [Tanacetum cinerariifolium]
YSFFYFEDEHDAEDAIHALDNSPFGYDIRRLSVEWARIIFILYRLHDEMYLLISGCCDRFPRVFALESAKEVLVVDKMGALSFSTSFRGMFRVKDIRLVLDDMYLPEMSDATRWVKCVPIKVNMFTWRARRDQLPTRINLTKRGCRPHLNPY